MERQRGRKWEMRMMERGEKREGCGRDIERHERG